MTKNNLKRIASPRTWDIKRKSIRFVTKPRPGAFSLDKGLALGTILRDYLKYAKNMKEAKYVLNNKDILINKIRIKDVRHIVGLMDVIEIQLINKFFRLLITTRNKLELIEIKQEEAQLLPLKILGITIIKGNLRQLNLSAGRTMVTKDKDQRPGDTILFDLKSKKIKNHFKLQENSFVYLTKGSHVGMSGIIEKLHNGSLTFKTNEENLETLKNYAFVIGKEKSTITLPE